jgi:hypothetical protein
MGMDVHGRKPTSEAGGYFRNNVWLWRPLADYVCKVAPELTSACKYWQSNDRDGLGKKASTQLASLLQAEIDSGRTKQYETEYTRWQEAIPDETCIKCRGSGQSNGVMCNWCDGKGVCRPRTCLVLLQRRECLGVCPLSKRLWGIPDSVNYLNILRGPFHLSLDFFNCAPTLSKSAFGPYFVEL